ncbi:hypothetical protein SRHO_G00044490 [Serrasalmus rhombeus]
MAVHSHQTPVLYPSCHAPPPKPPTTGPTSNELSVIYLFPVLHILHTGLCCNTRGCTSACSRIRKRFIHLSASIKPYHLHEPAPTIVLQSSSCYKLGNTV